MKHGLQPVGTYRQFTENVRNASNGARHVFIRIARSFDGLTALAISCAIRGEDPEAAAEHCLCEIAELDEVINALALSLTTAGPDGVEAVA